MRALAVAVLLLAACTREENQSDPVPTAVVPAPSYSFPNRPLRLGRIPHISQETTREENAPLAKYLTEQLGRPIEVAVPKDYETTIAQLERGEIDVAILAPLSYVVAKKRMPNLVLIAQLVADGGVQFLSYIVTAADGPLTSLAELKGKRFAFVDKRSTTGYLLPLDLLMNAGIDPAQDFKKVEFGGSHPGVVDLVLAHKADAGAIASTTFGQMRDANLKERLRIVAKSDPVPFDAVVARHELPPEFIEKLRATLLALSSRTEEGRSVLAVVTTNNGFVTVDDTAYDGVRRVADKLQVD